MITKQDVTLARANIQDQVKKTPLITARTLNELLKNDMYIKGEHLQTTGSFKIRGATNKVTVIAKEGGRHVIAASSGNHGQAVAYVAKELGLKATIVVPENATAAKVDAIKGYGANVIFCGFTSKDRIDRAKELAVETGARYIPPYDDPLIMAGQGTVGLEILEQAPDVDAIFVPVGGGGLISGILTAIKEENPSIKVIGVEPCAANDTKLSLEKGAPVTIDVPDTIADGLRSTSPGELTFPVLQKYLDDLILVPEDDIKAALRFLFQRMKQVVEPSGAVTLAAVMANPAPFENKKLVAVASGGNVDLENLAALLA
ncbi:threonine/serine dehydratase [Camelliibacillus cellulosilyticus]|uniref:Threonine/serine dehydratase n=1 Tax=Camelliibacillus cellulosilyticus TaxID=2174486 RepID=A0ABV9GS76_9BACL